MIDPADVARASLDGVEARAHFSSSEGRAAALAQFAVSTDRPNGFEPG